MLRLEGRSAVIIGGGSVAVRRAEALVAAHCQVRLIAPEVDPVLDAPGLDVEQRPYRRGDLDGAFLAIAATNDRSVNDAVAEEAAERSILFSRVDDASACDFTVPAQHRVDALTIAVSTDGISPKAAAEIVEHLRGHLDGDWVGLLGTLEPFRQEVKKRLEDPKQRQVLLSRFADEKAMRILKEQGHEGLADYYRQLLKEAEKL